MKMFIGSFVVVILSLSVFVYGMVFLDNGFKLDDKVMEMKKQIEEDLYKEVSDNFVNKTSIMPSAFIGQTNDGSLPKKRY